MLICVLLFCPQIVLSKFVACLYTCKSNGSKFGSADNTCRSSDDDCFLSVQWDYAISLCNANARDFSYTSSDPRFPIYIRNVYFVQSDIKPCNDFLQNALAPVAFNNNNQNGRLLAGTEAQCSCYYFSYGMLNLLSPYAPTKFTNQNFCTAGIDIYINKKLKQMCGRLKDPFLRFLCKTFQGVVNALLDIINLALGPVCEFILKLIYDLTRLDIPALINKAEIELNKIIAEITQRSCGFFTCPTASGVCSPYQLLGLTALELKLDVKSDCPDLYAAEGDPQSDYFKNATVSGTLSPTFDDSGCFPGHALVETLQGPSQMRELAFGDKVLSLSSKYEPIVFFNHHWEDSGWKRNDESHLTSYVVLSSAFKNGKANNPLWLTAEHMIPISRSKSCVEKTLVPAREIIPNQDYIFDVHDNCTVVLNKTHHTVRSAYLPVTPSGWIIVDGILVSCYTEDGMSTQRITLALFRALEICQNVFPINLCGYISDSLDFILAVILLALKKARSAPSWVMMTSIVLATTALVGFAMVFAKKCLRIKHVKVD